MKEVVIIGRKIKLTPRSKTELKGVTIGDTLMYRFYDGIYMGEPLLFIEPLQDIPTPRNCAITATRLQELLQVPIVYLLNTSLAYERQRLIDHGVYFVVSDKFAYLPMLIANERMRKTKPAKHLTPVAQYIVLYHLQVASIEGLTAKDIAEKLPYSYESVALGLTCLSDLALCEKQQDASRGNVIHFTAKGIELWQRVQKVAINSVSRRIYCDKLRSDTPFPICSINALAHYTRLNPDSVQMIMMSAKQLKELEAANALENANEYDGNVMIEVWKYPSIAALDEKATYVDKLSLWLSLQDDNDPRVEGERERLINEIIWKD